MGSINALLTYYLRVVSIIVTIATSSVYYALLIYFTNAEEIYNLPDWWSGRITFLRFATASGIVKITLPMVVMVAVVLLTQYLMAWTRMGRQVYALGGNPEAASRVGAGVLRVQLLAYGYLELLAAVAGFIQADHIHPAVPTAMAGQELNVLAVAILGGASLVGGVGYRSRRCLGCSLSRDATERAQSGWRIVVFFRRRDWLRHPDFRQHDRLCGISRTQTVRREARVMRAGPPGFAEPRRRGSNQLDRLITTLRERLTGIAGLFALLALLLAVFSVFMPATFPHVTTLQAMMFQLPELGLLSLAMAIPLISGGINLAIIATANQASLLMAWILTAVMPAHASGMTFALWLSGALAAGLLSCIVVGVITGLMVAAIGIHPILVTLGTMTLLHGLSIYFTRGRTLSGFPDGLILVSNKTIAGLPLSFVVFVIVALAARVLLTRTELGVHIHMIGSNLEATRFSGVNTRRVQVWVYLISSVLCWLAAIIMMARFNSAGADIAQSYLLITILAAILGGIDPYGGFGGVGGLFVALWILQVVASGFNLMNVSPHLALASWGMILLLVMAIRRFAGARGVLL